MYFVPNSELLSHTLGKKDARNHYLRVILHILPSLSEASLGTWIIPWYLDHSLPAPPKQAIEFGQ